MAKVKRLCGASGLGVSRAGPANALRPSRTPQGPARPVPGARPEAALPPRRSSFGVPRPGRAPSPSRRSGRGAGSVRGLPCPGQGPPGAPAPPPGPENAGPPYRVGSMVLAGAVTAGPRLLRPSVLPHQRFAARRAQSRLRAARSRELSPCPPRDPRAAPPGPGLPRVPVAAQRGRSPGRRLGQDTVSRRAGPAERAGPAGPSINKHRDFFLFSAAFFHCAVRKAGWRRSAGRCARRLRRAPSCHTGVGEHGLLPRPVTWWHC